jgi:hypothetical protein
MTPTYHIPSFVAILAAITVAAKFRKIIRRFINSGATSPGTSITWVELNLRRGFILKRLINRGVIIETSPERYYLHLDNLAEYNNRRRKLILIFLAVLIVIILLDVILLSSEF